MSIKTFLRTSLAATLIAPALPVCVQSYRHAPMTSGGRETILPIALPMDGSSFGTPWPSTPQMAPPATSGSAPIWTPQSSWPSPGVSYSSMPMTSMPMASMPGSSSIGPRPLPSRMHSSAFVYKRPTYRMPSAPAQPAPMPAPPAETALAPRQPAPRQPAQAMAMPAPPASWGAPPATAAAPSHRAQPQSSAAMPPPAPPAEYQTATAPTPIRQRHEPAPPQVHQASSTRRSPITAADMAQRARDREIAGDWPAAIAAYDALIQFEPSETRWRIRRAECSYFAGRFDLAVADYTMAAVSVRLSYDEFVRFGDAALRVGDYVTAERALAALAQATEQPTPQIELLRGIALLKQGHTRDARNVLLRASGRWPDHKPLTEALSMASAAHYGDRPLPDLDRHVERLREPKAAPVVNTAGMTAPAAQTMPAPPPNAGNWRATTVSPQTPSSPPSEDVTPHPVAPPEASSETTTIIEASAEIAAPAEVTPASFEVEAEVDAFAEVRAPSSQAAPKSAPPAAGQWRATSRESP